MKNFNYIYKFLDTDVTGVEDFDIVGANYKRLIEICCKYSTVFSLLITNPNAKLLKKLEKFEIAKSDNITFTFEHYHDVQIKYYGVCPELCNIITSNTNNIFCWINGWNFSNPEDPTFYRDDGSIFFTSTIHDGECMLMVRNEDVSEIIADERWIQTEQS